MEIIIIQNWAIILKTYDYLFREQMELHRLEIRTTDATITDILIECPSQEMAEAIVRDVGDVGSKLLEIITIITENPKRIELIPLGRVNDNDTILRYHHIIDSN
jgi:hypothetical protein